MSRPEQLEAITPVAETPGILDNARMYGLAALATVVTAVGLGDRAQAQAPVDRPDWPAIQNPIPDLNKSGTLGEEERMAEYCAEEGHGLNGPNVVKIKPSKRSTDDLNVRFSLDNMMDCNQLGRRTINMYLETKRPGQSKFTRGDSRFVRTHAQRLGKVSPMDINQSCSDGTVLISRLVSKVSYQNYDGKVTRKTITRPSTRVKC